MCAVKISRLAPFDLNPRGNLWMKDENRFGHKMLSRMGWSQGKGLGKHEDGIAENIKVKTRIGNTGVGWNDKLPLGLDTKDYDALLNNLNEKYKVSKEVKSELKVKSLEERSQQFKNRLHYQKFIKGKDVCRYSEKDLKSIFVTKKTETDKVPSPERSTVTNTDAPPTQNPSEEESLTTFKSQLSINDYFKMKMKQKLGELTNGNSVKPEKPSEAEEAPISEVPTCSKKRKKEFKISSKKLKKIKLEDSNESCDFSSVSFPEIVNITETELEEDSAQKTHSPDKSKKESPKKSKKNKLKKLKHLKSCLKSTAKKLFSREKEVSFCDHVSFKIIPGKSTYVDGVIHIDADNEVVQADNDEVEYIASKSDDSLNCFENDECRILNLGQNVEDDNCGNVETKDEGILNFDDSILIVDAVEESSETPKCLDLPKCDNSNYNSWLESQRLAAKMKLYKNMMKKIKKHPVLRKTNLLDIKGYGNWGF